MRSILWGVGGAVLLMSGCGQAVSTSGSDPAGSQVGDRSQPAVELDSVNAESQDSSALVPPGSDTLQPLPAPALIPPTSSSARVNQIQSGRSDPFAPIGTASPVLSTTSSRPGASLPVVPVAATPSLPASPVATVPIAALPPTFAPPSPAAAPAAPAPPPPSAASPAPASPPAPVLSLAQAIEISGVVQLGGRTSIIVTIPNESSSRYISVGDTIGNGQVLVKRVEMETAYEPVVILEQDGVEIVRTVGSSGAVGL